MKLNDASIFYLLLQVNGMLIIAFDIDDILQKANIDGV